MLRSMTSSRRSSGSQGGKRRVAAEAARGFDLGRPVLGDDATEAEPARAPAPPAQPVPDTPTENAYAEAIDAARHLIEYAEAKGLHLATVTVGAVSVTFAAGGGRPGVVTSIGDGAAPDLYEQYGGPLYKELVATLRKAADGPKG